MAHSFFGSRGLLALKERVAFAVSLKKRARSSRRGISGYLTISFRFLSG
jgi:hypothetical protein